MHDSNDAECALLGSLILDNQIYAQINTIVIADDFNSVQNRELFVQIETLLSKSQPVDAVILSASGNLYAFEVIRRPFVVENAVSYAQAIRNASLLRKLSVITSKFNVSTNNILATPEHIIHELSAELDTLKARIGGDQAEWLQDIGPLLVQPTSLKWLIKDWLPQNILGMLQAKPGVGKSFIALDWALHISCGLPSWFDHPVTPGYVVYLAGEGHTGLRVRMKAWSQYYNQSQFNMVMSSSPCFLDTPEGLMTAIEAIKKLKKPPILILIDTLHQFSSLDINAWKETGNIMNACLRIKSEFNATVLLMHHVGHSDNAQKRGMGSQALNIPLDVNINLIKDENNIITMQQVKMRDHEIQEKLLLELKSIEIDGWIDSDGNKMQSAVVGLASEQKENNYLGAKMKNAQKLFEEIWLWAGHKLTIDDKAYIFQAEMEEYARTVRNMNPNYVRKLISFNTKGSPFEYLLNTKKIEMYGEGCVVSDQEWAIKLLNIPVVK